MNVMHVIEQGDAVLLMVFALLATMSVASWQLIIWKSLQTRRERAALAQFAAHNSTADWPLHAHAAGAQGSVATLLAEAERLKASLPHYSPQARKDLLALHLPQALERIRTQFDKGLTVLASIGSSGPFIGLFGTVWGIYGALAHISAEGNASLNTVAGPMGEALVATAFGLFAAIPAVLAYNAFVRSNRLLLQELRHMAEQLATYLSLDDAAPVRLASVR
ncbi:MAG: MotA/TolQ/ExbB proton channel family protein [Alphaproteobacteria bacterium]|nr:MotA/TolQ/ExbB proton channel family protein [Alphaproteobacteria bacterium]